MYYYYHYYYYHCYYYYYYHHHNHHGHHHYESVLRDRKFDHARAEYSADYSGLLGTSQEDCASFSMTRIHLTAISAFVFVHIQ